jgi:hypothetical protein
VDSGKGRGSSWSSFGDARLIESLEIIAHSRQKTDSGVDLLLENISPR